MPAFGFDIAEMILYAWLIFVFSSTVALVQKSPKPLSRRGVDVKHQGEMTASFHGDELGSRDILGGELPLIDGDQCVVTRM